MPENLNSYTPPEATTPSEIIKQTDTTEKPSPKIEAPAKPVIGPKPISKPETEKSVEPKPSINPEELEKAKKHLSELYSPESATIDVGANIPEKFSNIEIAKEENPPEQVKPIDIDKSIPIEKEKPQKNEQQKTPEQAKDEVKKAETIDLSSTQIDTENVEKIAEKFSADTEAIENKEQETPEQSAEKAKASEELRQKQIEDAKAELEAQLKIINEAREKKDRASEESFLEKAKTSFEVATGESLIKKTIERADVEIKEDKLIRISRKNYIEKYTPKVEAEVEQRRRSKILTELWTDLSDKDKAVFDNNSGEFAKKKQGEITDKIQELDKKGIAVSEKAFYAMMEKGLKPEDIKVRGFWGKLFMGNEIEIPRTALKDEKPKPYEAKKNSFMEMAKDLEEKFTDSIKDESRPIIERNIEIGQKMWRAKKQKSMRDVIGDTIEVYKNRKKKLFSNRKLKIKKKPKKNR